MSDIFEKNLKALEARKPDLTAKIRELPASTIEVEEAKNGERTFKYEGVYFHSRYDPVKEALRLSDELKESGFDYTLIFGMGFGYLPRAFKKAGGGKLLIFEPSADILRGIFSSVDLTDIIEDEDIFITENMWEVSAIIRAQAQPTDIIGVHVSPPYKKFFATELSSYTQTITNAQISNRVAMHTTIGSSDGWFMNYLENVHSFLKFPPIDALKDSFKGLPVFIIGAGPSLEKNASLLKKVKGRALIIAAIAAYKPLLSYGVVPDFVIGIEKVDLGEYFTNSGVDKDIRLLAGDTSSPTMFTEHGPKGIFTIFSTFIGASDELNALFGNRFQPVSGGSVTTTALDIAIFFGAAQVIFLGQDLAYGKDGTHAKGSVYGDQTLDVDEEGKVSVLSDYAGHDKCKPYVRIAHWLDGVDGEKVMTRFDWVCFHQWLVDYVKIYKDEGGGSEIINATEGGAYIDGMAHITLEEVIEKYIEPLGGDTEEIERIISRAEENFNECDIKGIIAQFEKTLSSFKKVLSISEDSLKRMASIKKNYSKSKVLNNCRKDILALSKNENRLIRFFDESTFLSKILQKVGYEIEEHLKKEKLSNAEEQFMVDMNVTRSKNEAIVKLCRHYEPLLLNLISELGEIKTSEGSNS